MADAYCGPSNPLQSFQKHAQADRTLQQDRLVARGQPRANVGLFDRHLCSMLTRHRAFAPSTRALGASTKSSPPSKPAYQNMISTSHSSSTTTTRSRYQYKIYRRVLPAGRQTFRNYRSPRHQLHHNNFPLHRSVTSPAGTQTSGNNSRIPPTMFYRASYRRAMRSTTPPASSNHSSLHTPSHKDLPIPSFTKLL